MTTAQTIITEDVEAEVEDVTNRLLLALEANVPARTAVGEVVDGHERGIVGQLFCQPRRDDVDDRRDVIGGDGR